MRNVLVLGGSEGLGYCLAKDAASMGLVVTVLARHLNNQAAHLNIRFLSRDINDLTGIEDMFSSTQPDTVILNAAEGVWGHGPYPEYRREVATMTTTFTSNAVWLCESLRLLPRGGRIGWISSLTALIPSQNWAFYSASKAGIEYLVRCIRPLSKKRGISVTVCYPGCLATRFHAKVCRPTPREAVDPSQISSELLRAIGDRKEFWAVESDRQIVIRVRKSQAKLDFELDEGNLK
jgi:short-subunit dehydrogenase